MAILKLFKNMKNDSKCITRVIASSKNWIESDAVNQLKLGANLEGMLMAVGLPDLHPGKGYPIGAAFITEETVYPYIIGNDIGCGMALWQTSLSRSKMKRDRWAEKLRGLEDPFNEQVAPWLEKEGLTPNLYDSALGTIGGGNHFAELQAIEKVHQSEKFQQLNLDHENLFLLVHSGSRGLGESILRAYVDAHRDDGLLASSDEGRKYLHSHDLAVQWAKANRGLIAYRFMSMLGANGDRVLDAPHNMISQKEIDGKTVWIHRKGAAPSDQGAIVIPGSRGALSYLVEPIGDLSSSAWSLAHGAGRKWTRSHSYGRIRDRFRKEQLIQTELGSRVICEDKDLLYEEAPPVYKNIEIVIQDLVDAGLIQVLASLRPVITYKTRTRKE